MNHSIRHGRSVITIALFVAAMMISSIGLAREEMSRHCKSDIEKYCSDVKPGHGRVSDCLRDHERLLSNECRDHMNLGSQKGDREEKIRTVKDSCEKDRRKYCKDVEEGRGRVARCLRQNEASLSEGCRQQLAGRTETRDVCKRDREVYCSDVEPGQGRIKKCLKKNKKKISTACRESLRL